MTATTITLDAVSKRFGDIKVIPGLTTEIRGGEFTVILGPSGCGKSTLLNLLAGLESVSAGTIRFGEREVQGMPAKDRGCAMVFQNYALYPHMKVADNIGYALKLARVKKDERQHRIAAVAELTGLSEFLDRRPSQLSGGQRQRVAIARAIIREPDVLLFDEPLSNLDAKLRHGMRMELAQLHRRLGATSIFVTHDQVEAMTLADRIMVLNHGQIEQFDTPEQIYRRPASTFVAGFMGSPPMNLVAAMGGGGQLRLVDGTALAPHDHEGPVTVGIRPEQLQIAEAGVPVRVVYHEDLGSHRVLVAHLPDDSEIQVTAPIGVAVADGDRLHVVFHGEQLQLFERDSGRALR